MAQGTRGRLAMLGTSLLFCLGCMNDDPKSIGKPPLAKSTTVKPNQPASGTQFGGGVQNAPYNLPSRTPANTDYFKTGSMTPTTSGVSGTGTSMAPPMGVVPATTPNNPYAGGRPVSPSPTYPPPGFEALPPPAPGGPTSAYPMAPMAPTIGQPFSGN